MSKMLIVAFAVTAVFFLILDAIWLGLISRNLYQREIGELLLPKPNLGAAGVFYVIYIMGLVYFCAGRRGAECPARTAERGNVRDRRVCHVRSH
jgi:uncharacterized membrane protein